jgi:hypothetical protein
MRRLMMAALDGEISTDERLELERALALDGALRREWESMSRVKAVTSEIGFREPPEEVWGQYWTSVYNRTERGVGWILVSVGAIVLLGYGAWEFVTSLLEDTAVPWPIKFAILAVALGLVTLGVSVAREKFFTWRRDPYKEIER